MSARVLLDLARFAEPPAIFVCARRAAAVDVDLTQTLDEVAAVEMAEVLTRAAERAAAKRFLDVPALPSAFGRL